ncbi:MAG: dihydrodipicolinate synthase family protein [Gemmatimonadales bacterium]|nr:dihydrodipicolinate synthase family protein [Gemmatimonadales bacterium]
MTSKGLCSGVLASTTTPFRKDGTINYSQIPAHVDWIVAEGVHGISPLGSSGEFPALERDERKRVLEAVLSANNGRVSTMAGTHCYSTRHTIELSQHAERAGADALLIVPPFYMSPTISQTLDHYRRIAEAVSIPIVLYHNIPLTNIDLGTPHLITLFEEGAIQGVKMSNPEPDRICQLLQATDRKLVVYAGIDNAAFEGLCHGAHGWISGIPSMVPRAARRLYDAIAIDSDLSKARREWARLAPLMRMQFAAYLGRGDGAHWFSVMKATLNLIGPPVGDPAPPVLPLEAEWRSQLIPMLRDLGYETGTSSP